MKFVFYIPEHVSNSNGISLLWEFAYAFSKKSDVVVIEFDNGGNKSPYAHRDKLMVVPFRYSYEDETVIYPDIVTGDPLKCSSAIRLLMAKPGMFNQSKDVFLCPGNFFVAYSKAVSGILPRCNILSSELRNLSKIKKSKKSKVTIYYGKCRPGKGRSIRKIIDSFDSVEIVTRLVPANRNSLYESLSESRLLVTFDPLTQLIFEANLLGTPVFLADDCFSGDFNEFDHPIPGILDSVKQISVQCFDDDYFENLREESQRALERSLQNIDSRIEDLINLVEDWRCGRVEGVGDIYDQFLMENRLFLKEWGLKPLVIVNRFNGVLAYHALSRFPLVYLTLRFCGALISLVTRFCGALISLVALKSLFDRVIREMHPVERDYIHYYLGKWRTSIPDLPPNPRIPSSAEDALDKSKLPYTVQSGIKFYIWKFLCT